MSSGGGISNDIEARAETSIISFAGSYTSSLVGVEIGIVIECVGAWQTLRVTYLRFNEDWCDCCINIFRSGAGRWVGSCGFNLLGDLDD